MSESPDNQAQLREAGVIVRDELPQEYAAVVDGLTPEELETIIRVKQRLDEAGDISESPIGENMIAP